MWIPAAASPTPPGGTEPGRELRKLVRGAVHLASAGRDVPLAAIEQPAQRLVARDL